MINPWHKRANELIRDPLALLPLISPAPIRQFFKGDATSLFDRLVVVVGSPGSGKTTLARLLELGTLMAAVEASDRPDIRPLIEALNAAGLLDDLVPTVLAVRLPANSLYRGLWELPYPEETKHKLLRSLIQARAVLGWFRQLEADETLDVSVVRIHTVDVGEAHRAAIAADSASEFRELARKTEAEIFRVLSALVPPPLEQLSEHISSLVYEPLVAVSAIEVPSFKGRTGPFELRPMVMIDDAHELHSSQFADLDVWLRNREVRTARWVLTRVDSISPSEFRRFQLEDEIERPPAGTSPGRDRLIRPLQGRKARQPFRQTVGDIGRRYMSQIPSFAAQGLNSLGDALPDAQPRMAQTAVRKLRDEVKGLGKRFDLSDATIQAAIDHMPPEAPEELRLAVARIILHREALRTPQRSLFSAGTSDEAEPQLSRKIDSAVVVGAELQLLHDFGRPFFYGMDRLADASGENIEQFINLASVLVDQLETLVIRRKRPQLEPQRQHDALVAHANKLMSHWDFPYAPRVKLLVDFIADRAIELTRRPNAPLDDGANAFGVPQSDIKALEGDPDFENVIHYALAYQAIVMVEEYKCKGELWCIFELGGVACLAKGLTLMRGGFVEGRLEEMRRVVAR